MSAIPDDPDERRRVSKVSISPISSELLVVRIRKISAEVKEEDIPKVSSTFKPVRQRKPGYRRRNSGNSKSTMTDKQEKDSNSSETMFKEQTGSSFETDKLHDCTPCIKHAAQNISRVASNIPSEKINLCSNCSKSMLSYIFLVQDFLDSLAKEISGGDTSQCLQCAREEVRNNVASLEANVRDPPSTEQSASKQAQSENRSDVGKSGSKRAFNEKSSNRRTEIPVSSSGVKSQRQESKKNEDSRRNITSTSPQGFVQRQSSQVDFLYDVSSPSNVGQEVKGGNVPVSGSEKRIIKVQSTDQNVDYREQTVPTQQNNQHIVTINPFNSKPKTETPGYQSGFTPHVSAEDNHQRTETSFRSNEQDSAKTVFRAPMERVQPNYEAFPAGTREPAPAAPYSYPEQHSPSLFKDVDGIVSTLSNKEREIYDNARNGAGWESLTQERLGTPTGNMVVSEAFVTSCRNNAEAIGCLVVGTSLLLCRTSKTLCVLVSDGVSTAFRGALSSVFQVVQFVRSLDSLGTTKLALLEQPDLGITFEKLNIWRLVQFTKCVYLNPDTLVIQNCDELFDHEELSAVPDIGWPDCFNSGVFVFSPSIQTFWQLLEFSEKQGSYDGGDQGLLNSYYSSWSSDISKKLSFIYNLMANVSYTYTPAFRQFGRNVKIVQFHGTFKPWHVKFFPNSGQVSPSSPVHPTYIQFVHIWLNIFRISVLRLMSQEIQSYAASQETICAVEILRFFPLPSESETDFFLTPPSVRLRLAEKKLSRSTSLPISEARRRKSAEFSRYIDPEDETTAATGSSEKVEKDVVSVELPTPEAIVSDEQEKAAKDSISEGVDEVFKEREVTEEPEIKDENALPGAEIGDYQGMKKWEQGRMDYQGTDSSDNVIKRLEFLMSRPN